MSKIYVSVSGGCVNAVLSNDPGIVVEIWDWDNIKAEFEDTFQLEDEWATLQKTLTDIL